MRNLPDFVPPEALSLFLAKKYLSAAIALKSKKSDNFGSLCESGHREFMRYPVRVNLEIALSDYLALDMLLEGVTLALKVIHTVEDIRKLSEATQIDGVVKEALKMRQGQQDRAIKAIIDIMSEIILRIKSLEGAGKVTMPEVPKDSIADKVRKRLNDAKLSVDYLKDLKARILRLSARTQCEYFHIQLYELLLSHSLTYDLKIIQTP